MGERLDHASAKSRLKIWHLVGGDNNFPPNGHGLIGGHGPPDSPSASATALKVKVGINRIPYAIYYYRWLIITAILPVQLLDSLHFWATLWRLYKVQRTICSSWSHWKARSGTSFARCYGWGATGEYRFKIGNFSLTRHSKTAGAMTPIHSWVIVK